MSYATTVAAVAAVAGAAVSAYSSMEQGKQQKKMYEAQAQQAVNAAAYDADAAKAHAEQIRKLGKAQVGEANAALAASGVKLGEGTPLEVTKSIVQNYEQDAFSAILSGERVVNSANEEAALLNQAGSNAQKSGNMNAVGTVLSSGATLASNWKTISKGGK